MTKEEINVELIKHEKELRKYIIIGQVGIRSKPNVGFSRQLRPEHLERLKKELNRVKKLIK